MTEILCVAGVFVLILQEWRSLSVIDWYESELICVHE